MAHKKAPPPKMGEAFGSSFGKDQLASMQLPGGGILQFDLSRLTLGDYRAMRDHYQVNISLAVLTFMMHQLDWRVECSDKKIAEAAEDQLRLTWTRLVRAMSQAYWAGYSPIVTQWENDAKAGRINFTKFKDLVPENCRVNWKEVRGYAPPSHAAPKHLLFDGIKERGTSFPVPAENSLWYPLLMENGDHYGRKLLRPAFPAWFFSQLMHLFSNRYFERFGEPLPVGRAPFEEELQTSDGTFISGKTAMENILGSIRNRSVVVLPNNLQPQQPGSSSRPTYDYEIEYLESQMRGADFERYMTRLDEEISLALFTPLLLVRTADSGSYNLGAAHMQMYLWMHNALAGDFREYLNKYVLDRFVDFNYGPNAPRANWAFKPGGKTDAETLRAIITGLIRNGAADVDLAELGTAIGLSVKEVEQVTEPPLPPDGPGDPAPVKPQPKKDPRAGRVRATQVRDTKQKIASRLAEQIEKRFRDQGFGAHPARPPAMGYRRAFELALGASGLDADEAVTATEILYGRMNHWLTETSALPAETFGSAAAYLKNFDTLLDAEIDALVA